jgi:hypothetical protein
MIHDDALIRRGGTMSDREAAVTAAEDAEAELDEHIYGLSVECFVLPTIDDALRASQRPNRQVRHSTAYRIRAAGLDVVPTRGEPHGTVVVPKPLDEDAWRRLQQVFDGPIINPYTRKRS